MNNMSAQPSIDNKSALLPRTRRAVIWCIGTALFWVIFLWGFWNKGVYALGINAFVYFVLVLCMFLLVMKRNSIRMKENFSWIIPLFLITLSFALYDNPFLKILSVLAFPLLFGLFYNYSFLEKKERVQWGIRFIGLLIFRFLSLFAHIRESLSHHIQLLFPSSSGKKNTAKRVLLGIVLFLVIALTIIIPLLSSADTIFAQYMETTLGWFRHLISVAFFYKLLFFVVLSVITFATVLGWGRQFQYNEKDDTQRQVDPIISGIVLGGILILYLLFLAIQIKQLWIGNLPFDFKETEYLVKSGFWQLLVVSVINIVIFFFTYKKTNTFVQRVLLVFTIASLLLLVSAGYRMGLYVTYYGFSYEKFFASYTVVFCAILFVWLIVRLFKTQQANIIKFLVFLFLWMYAVLTIFPVEQFVLRANVSLAQREDTRIRLYELTMLSPDVLGLVKQLHKEGKLSEAIKHIDYETQSTVEGKYDWTPWIERNEHLVAEKEWYEVTMSNIVYRLSDN